MKPVASRWVESIHFKILAAVFGVAFAVVTFFTIYFPQRHIDQATRALEAKAATYGNLLDDELRSAVAFDDHETAREVFAAIAEDPDVHATALYSAAGVVIAARGEVLAAPPTGVPSASRVERDDSIVRCITPVHAKEGVHGTLIIELSTAGLRHEEMAIRQAAVASGVAALLLAFAAAWFVSRSLSRRIHALADVAARVAGGELETALPSDAARDEVGQLTLAFGTMVRSLKGLLSQISVAAAEENARLDRLVAARTLELANSHRETRLLLDHVGQGFLVVDPNGGVGAARSAVVDRWFGAVPTGMGLAALFERSDPAGAAWLALGWETLTDGVLPFEVAAAQLPRRLPLGKRELEVGYSPIYEGTSVVSILVVMTDVTAERDRQLAEVEQRETLAALECALADSSGFEEFLAEADQLVNAITGADVVSVELMRALHTLKGNCGIFRLNSVAALCHDLETRLADSGDDLCEADRNELRYRFGRATSVVRALTGTGGELRLELSRADYDGLLGAARAGDHVALVRGLELLALEPFDSRLRRAAEQARGLAEVLEKPDLDIRVAAHGLRFVPGRWGSFWSAFVHVVRNAVDHGLEAPEERESSGKPRRASLALEARIDGRTLVLSVADDGRGIDWAGVAKKAKERGLPGETREDLVEALFADGVSTREEVSELSGRGVGLAALRAAISDLEGVIGVSSVANRGTTFEFVFPLTALGDAYRGPSLIPRAA